MLGLALAMSGVMLLYWTFAGSRAPGETPRPMIAGEPVTFVEPTGGPLERDLGCEGRLERSTSNPFVFRCVTNGAPGRAPLVIQ